MYFLGLFAAAFVVSFILQWAIGRAWLSMAVPALGFAAFILADEYILPYRGGGASMWPIALVLGEAVVLTGAGLGLVSDGLRPEDERALKPRRPRARPSARSSRPQDKQ